MKIHLLGSGSVGSLLAFHLQRAIRSQASSSSSSSSKFAGDQLYLHSLRAGCTAAPGSAPSTSSSSRSITVESTDGHAETQDGFLFSQDDDGRHSIDVLFVAVKADQTLSAIAPFIPRLRRRPSRADTEQRQMQTNIDGPSSLIFLQNGVGQAKAVVDRFFPQDTPGSQGSMREGPFLLLGSNTHGTWRREKRHVVHAAQGAMHFALASESAQALGLQSSTESLLDLLSSSTSHEDPAFFSTLRHTLGLLTTPSVQQALGTSVEPSEAFAVRALRKLVVNCALNPLTALEGCRNGELLDASRPERREQVDAIVSECAEVLRARSPARSAEEAADDDGPLSLAQLLEHVHGVIRSTAPNWSSMVQDVRSGRGATEVDFLNGTVVRWGDERGVPTPRNREMVQRIKEKVQEQGARTS